MSLTLNKLRVRDVRWGDRTAFDQGCLSVDAPTLSTELKRNHDAITTVQIDLALPRESTRIVCCKDAVQPSVKSSGTTVGTGTRLVLEHVAVVTCGPIVGFQEGIIDMSGCGAAYTPFSQIPLVVLQIEVAKGLSPHEHEAVLRGAGLDAAEYIARACIDCAPDESEELVWDEIEVDPDLPRIAYVYMVLSQGLLHDTYVLGRNAMQGLPASVDPRIVMDAGLVSGNCVSACDKNTTYHHRNNPIVAALLRGHGVQWNFVGVVITNAPTRLGDKEQSARAAVNIVCDLDAHGAIVTKEGFGNPDADFMMILRALEEGGVHCVGVTDEFAGADGGSQSLADSTPDADAIVSTGNANERILLPPMTTTLGPLPDVSRLAGGYAGSIKADGSISVELQAIMGATNELGFGRLSCREV